MEQKLSTVNEVHKLRSEIMPESPKPKLDLLKEILTNAQRLPPDEKYELPEAVNTLLKSINHRIQLSDGSMCLTSWNPGSTGKGFLQLRTSLGPSRGWPKSPSEYEIVPVPPRPRRERRRSGVQS